MSLSWFAKYRSGLALLCGGGMAHFIACAPGQYPVPVPKISPEVSRPLLEALGENYNDLFDQAPRLEFNSHQIQRMREFLNVSQQFCKAKFEKEAKAHEESVKQLQSELNRKTKALSDADRKDLHCRIQNARIRRTHSELMAKNAIPAAYQNRAAKLDVIQKWPAELIQVRARIEAGTHLGRTHGDVKDIGFRGVGKGQEDDIKTGQRAIDEMKRSGMLPKELDDEAIGGYVTDLATRIAARSDLKAPLKITVLNSPEINAFALPGGFLFVHRGLIEAAEDEAQLAGVIAHEISHAAARHGHRLMRRATIASVFYQAAQVAAIIFTGGIASLGAYYALQYGFYGLGLLLSLDLLGVSRDLELEADQLGVQYAWNAGYDPTGFIRFFDIMANREGYVQGLSWFRTHPPFYERMVHTKLEILYLPQKDQLIRQSSKFEAMKKRLAGLPAGKKDDDKKKPSLLLPEVECPKPELAEYKPGQNIEMLCGIPLP
jgi:hypothetical protein